MFGPFGLYRDRFWAWSFASPTVKPPFFLLADRISFGLLHLHPQLLPASLTEFFNDAFPFQLWLTMTFLSGMFYCSFSFPLLCVSNLLLKTYTSRLSPPPPREWFDFTLWIAHVFSFAGIHCLLLASLLHNNCFQTRHQNLRTHHLWKWPYLFPPFLKTWLGTGF